jgi:hypothetical protein
MSVSIQLDLPLWEPPKARKPRKSRSCGDDMRDCACGQNIGRGVVWRDDTGVDHIECEACSTGPRFPYYRGPRETPYTGSIGDAESRAQNVADFDEVWPK